VRIVSLAITLGLVTSLGGCSKSKDDRAARPEASASAAAAGGASAAPNVAKADAGAAPAAGAATEWNGSYEATEGTLYVPEGKEWAGVKFRGEKSDVGLGKGTLTFSIDPRGNVVGTLEGPLGPAVIRGALDKTGAITAQVAPQTPSDTSFYGTFNGKQSDAAIEGKMQLSQSEARVIREAKVTAKRK
jgi:hypothetical protein